MYKKFALALVFHECNVCKVGAVVTQQTSSRRHLNQQHSDFSIGGAPKDTKAVDVASTVLVDYDYE